MIRTNTIMKMKDFLLDSVFHAVIAVITVITVIVVLAVTTASIAEVTVVADIVVAEAIVAVAVAMVVAVVVEVVAEAAVAAEADKISVGKKYNEPLHLDVEAILFESKHKGQITVHRMIVMILKR